MAKTRTHYDNLKVARNAPVSVIKAAYKALCQTYHPDKFQCSQEEAERIMKIINTSYAVLIDPIKRKKHDAWIGEQEGKAKQQSEKVQFDTNGEATEQRSYQAQDKHDVVKTKEPSPAKNGQQQKSKPLSIYKIKSSPIKWNKWLSNFAFLMWGSALIWIVITSILGEIKHKEETVIPSQVQTQPAQVGQKSQQTASLNINTSKDISQADASNIENDIRKSAEILNKNLPMTIDRNYRLDNIIAGPGLLFTYNYTILTVTSREIDQAYLQDNKHDLKAEICSQPDMKIFFENKVITRYSYRGSDGGFIGNIDITPRDCGYGI